MVPKKLIAYLVRTSEMLPIGLRIFHRLSNETDLLISEDVALLASAFEHQMELDKFDKPSKFESSSITKWILAILLPIIMAILAIILKNDTFGIILSVSAILISLFLVIVISLKKYIAKKFNDQFMCLVEQTIMEKQTFRKLKELIDDNWSFTNSEDYGKRLKSLKTCFRDVGLRCLLDFRRCTLVVKSELALKSDIDDNLISGLPDDLYESYQQEELDAKALKSLKQLIKLQVSEFYQRILLLFVQNYYQDSTLFRSDLIFRIGTDVLTPMIGRSKERCNELLSLISFYKSLYEPKSLQIQPKIKQENECSAFWSSLRNVRRTVYRSISIIEESESLLENHSELVPGCQSNLNDLLETLSEELSGARQNVLDIQKTLLHKINGSSTMIDSNLSCERPQQDANNGDYHSAVFQDDEPPKDEVFEAFVPETTEELKIEADNDPDKVFDLDTEKLKDAENNLYWELKNALKGKAIEHRMREAKAQGIQVDPEQIEQDYDRFESEKRDTSSVSKSNPYQPPEPNNFKLEFNFNLALPAATKLTGLSIEETFGESGDED